LKGDVAMWRFIADLEKGLIAHVVSYRAGCGPRGLALRNLMGKGMGGL